MLFNSISRDSGCVCIKCGPSPYEGISTTVQRQDQYWDLLTICSKCLFTGGIDESLWNRFLGKKDEPKQVPEPAPIKPRWMA